MCLGMGFQMCNNFQICVRKSNFGFKTTCAKEVTQMWEFQYATVFKCARDSHAVKNLE